MKLNKKLAILGVGIATSTGALAQTFYQCLPCPSGTYSSNSKCIECARDYYCSNGTQRACPSGTYAPPGATSCCAGGQYAGNSSCFSPSDLRLSHFTQIASGGAGSASCPTGTLQAGWYLVRLRGGKGGNGKDKDGAEGGTLQYTFFLPSTAKYQLCAGGNGTRSSTSSFGSGGGGSWLKLNFGGKDYYFVAGGGSGGGEYGGGGGGIGAGGNAGAHDGDGGRSGPYFQANNVSTECSWFNKNCPTSKCGLEDTYRTTFGCGGGGGYSSSPGSPITINIINGYKTTSTINKIFGGHSIYSGFSDIDTIGKSSHSSNVSSFIGACGSSCAILYKLNL